MTNEEMKAWIDGASYGELLQKWRFAPCGDPLFQGEIGKYYGKVMRDKRAQVGDAAAVAVSEKVGWG